MKNEDLRINEVTTKINLDEVVEDEYGLSKKKTKINDSNENNSDESKDKKGSGKVSINEVI